MLGKKTHKTEQNTVRIMMQVTDKLSVRCSRQEEVKGGLLWFLGSLETDSGICHYGLQLNFAFHATCKVQEPAEGDSASDQDHSYKLLIEENILYFHLAATISHLG